VQYNMKKELRLSRKLSLDPSGGVAAGKRFHFLHGYAVEVARNGMLQTAGRHGKIKRILRIFSGNKRVNKSAGK